MNIKCTPTRELYSDFTTGYRVLSCKPVGYFPDLHLSKYMNFTLAGSNLGSLQIGQEANLSIEPDLTSRYDASYTMLSYAGIEANGEEINVDPKYELEILRRLMSDDQAKNVNEAYPDFVNLVLNGKEDTIDFHTIKNVGIKRLTSYIQKVQEDCKIILLYPVAFGYGITSSDDITKLQALYKSPSDLESAMKANPYEVYIGKLKYGFDKADRLALQHFPEFEDTQERCEYACLSVLQENESLGDTRLDANILSREIKEIAPECRHHIVKAVKESPLIHFDNETKYVSIETTFQDEALIALNVLVRKIPLSYFDKMDWEPFRNVDGFECTDEQVEILKIVANGGRIGILTGSGGSGKTSSIKALIRMLEANHRSYTLLAPTGVAAKRMRESTGRYASTIHMFLMRQDTEAGEYVIVDEMSMVSVQLLSSLLQKIGDTPNLIFVCDEAQLASISCGNIVQDLIDSGVVPRANLTKIFRYGEGGIATIATDARFGTMKNLHTPYDDFKFVPIDDPVNQVLEEYGKLLEKGYTKDDILVLTPYNKGKKGTCEINRKIQSIYNKNPMTFATYERKGMGKISFKVGDRVLNTHNNYHMPTFEEDGEYGEMGVFNGDIGVVREVRGSENAPELIVEFDEGLAVVKGQDIANLLLGYSVTVHKCQGAQSKAVIVVIDKEHSRLLSRNLLYVAFSRAQKEMVVIADEDVLDMGLETQENMERDTWLCDMLKGDKDEQY